MADLNTQDPTLVGSLALSSDEQRVVRTLITALRRIRYGSVQIVVQDGRVFGVDTLEKQRINSKDAE